MSVEQLKGKSARLKREIIDACSGNAWSSSRSAHLARILRELEATDRRIVEIGFMDRGTAVELRHGVMRNGLETTASSHSLG